MKVLITFKIAGDKEWTHNRSYYFDPKDAELLRKEFLAYLNGGKGQLRGAEYNCLDPDTGQPRNLVLRFDDISYIECMARETSHETKPDLKTTTGPLQARLSTGGLGEA